MKPSLLLSVGSTIILVSCAHPNTRNAHADSAPRGESAADAVQIGRALFLKNCAHCHGADALGDEGPDLHNLDWTDEQIVTRIRNGKKGQMTAFAGKLHPAEIQSIIDYVRTLK